jgi:hypothetical protein
LVIEASAYQHSAIGLRTVILCEFKPHRGFGVTDLVTPLPRIDKLSECEGDQYAEHNDPHLADQGAPAVHWLG